MNKIENYLGIANHDIQMANNSQELKSYVASILCKNDELQQENKQLKSNWNKLKQDIGYELLKLREPNEYNNGLVNGINYVLNTMQELEILSKGENK